jgi:hypothetical protein
MSRITSDTVAGYFDRLNWSYRVVDELTILTGYRCPVPFYDYGAPLEVKIGEHWMYIRSLLQRDVAPAQAGTVLTLVSQLNCFSHRARFVLIDDCVLVQAELPLVQCHPPVFLEALIAVCEYTRQAGVEIAMLATNPSVSDLYQQVQDALSSNGDGRPVMEDLTFDFDLTVNALPENPPTE